MTPYDGGTTSTEKQLHPSNSGVGPPTPIPRPPPPPGSVAIGSPAPGDNSRHHRQHQPPHMGMPPVHHNQGSSMNYPLPHLPPSPQVGAVGPPGPPSYHMSHSQHSQRHHSYHPPQHHHNSSHPSHHPPQHHSQHHTQHHTQHLSQRHHPQHPPGSLPPHGLSGPLHHSNSPSPHHPQHRIDEQKDDQNFSSISAVNISNGSGNGEWQSERDLESRREMIQQIIKLLKRRDDNVSPDWMTKLPEMVRRLEVSLYKAAPSFEAYSDKSTLKTRLQDLAMEIANKTSNNRPESSSSQGSNHNGDSARGILGHIPSSDIHLGGRGSQPQPQIHRSTSEASYNVSSSQQNYNAPNRQNSLNNDSQSMVNNMMDPSFGGLNNPMNTYNPSGSGSNSLGDNRYPNPMGIGNGLRTDTRSIGQQPSPYLRHQTGPPNLNMGQLNQSHGSMNNHHRSREEQSQKEKNRIRRERLFILHHSWKCKAEDGKCRKFPHCAEMKRLWKHMAHCNDTKCITPHCFSSRSVLSHYRKCTDAECEICKPVRAQVQEQRNESNQIPQNNPYPIEPPNNSMPPSHRMDNNNPGRPPHSSDMGGMYNHRPPYHDRIEQHNPPSYRDGPSSHQRPPYPPHGRNGFSDNQYGYPPQSQHPETPYNPNTTNNYRDYPRSNGGMPPEMRVEKSHHSSNSPGPFNSSNISRSTSNIRPQHRSEEEIAKIKHKQKRLLLLRHASKCPYPIGECPKTELCGTFKKLWKHIGDCNNPECNVQHCRSSKFILSHFRKCKDRDCEVCRPVKEHIERNNPDRQSDRNSSRSSNQFNMNDRRSSRPIAPPNDTYSNNHDMHREKRRRPDYAAYNPYLPSLPQQNHRYDSRSSASFQPPEEKNSVKPETTSSVNREQDQRKKPEIDSLISCFTIDQIETHIKSLNRTRQLAPAELKKRCLEVLQTLKDHPSGWVFARPVDPVELDLPDYFTVIKHPMDFSTIQKRLENGLYHSIDAFSADVHLTFDNATTYNQEGSPVHEMATNLRKLFVNEYNKFQEKLKKEEDARRANDRACSLCGCEKLTFEPPVFFCHGLNCQSKRIRRNSHYYVGGSNQYFWCNQCYNELDEGNAIELVDANIKKSELIKKKNDEVVEESWVQCDTCKKWIHQICGLFNFRQNKEQNSVYSCPSCTLDRRKKEASQGKYAIGEALLAEDLPRTNLSERLERHVREKVEENCMQAAKEKADSDKTSIDDALKNLDIGGPVTIRQVTSTDRKLEVRDRMKKRYAYKNYPDEFPFRCKCIVVFQNIDGVDVLLFALYVYEHDEKNPKPNQRTVYISYLDSVHFMRPRRIRTIVYHEILICYLDYARERGFETAHIWACPPLKGDDYIFYAKPDDQKTPKDHRLRQWYIDMLKKAQTRGVVGKVTNMYDLYFSDKTIDATAVPYLEGDYFPGEAENIIKDLEEGNGRKSSSSSKKSKKKRSNSTSSKNDKSKSKSKSGRTGTRSSTEEEDLKPSAPLIPVDGEKDPVMAKLGEIIQPMKASFIVAFLNWSGATEEHKKVPKEIEEARVEYSKEQEEKKKREDELLAEEKSKKSNKRDRDGDSKNKKSDLKRWKLFFGTGNPTNLDRKGRPLKIINDDKEDMDCEFFNNRQLFLDLCRGNHYQFDEVRRAKHTSMMILWHLHNRDAPKFVQQCVSCSREILTGIRHHCEVCTDYDLCDECFKNPNTNRGNCTHTLKPISVEAENEKGEKTSAQLEQRQRNMVCHLKLLHHAANCLSSSGCTSKKCAKMKQFIKHIKECKIKVVGGCKICKRMWTLLRYHAQQCKNPVCNIPLCKDIRLRLRQMKEQQQAMDDRRRREMNRHLRGESQM